MICWVMDHGVPFDTAHALEEGELLAYTIAFGEIEGAGDWDWGAMKFVKKEH